MSSELTIFIISELYPYDRRERSNPLQIESHTQQIE